MSQIALPFEEPVREAAPAQAVPATAAQRQKREVKSEDDCPSSEENDVQVSQAKRPAEPVRDAVAPLRPRLPARPRSTIAVAWPAGLTWDDALAYSSLSASQLRRWQKAGALTVRRVGQNGARVVMRSELDRLLEEIFAPAAVDISEDFDFG